MHNVIYGECHTQALYAQLHFAECRYAECHGPVCIACKSNFVTEKQSFKNLSIKA